MRAPVSGHRHPFVFRPAKKTTPKLSESAKVSMGGKVTVVFFFCMLFSGVSESALIQYTQTTLGYNKPYFIFFVVHTAFALILPLHLAYLTLSGRSVRNTLRDLHLTVKTQLRSESGDRNSRDDRFPIRQFLRLCSALTAGYSIPSILWFCALPLSPLTDLMAIGNTSAFWSYVLSVKLFRLRWQPKRLLAVVIATLGTLAVLYGGAEGDKHPPEVQRAASESPSLRYLPMRLIGNMCVLVGAVGGALYQVLYKMYIALPTSVQGASSGSYHRIKDEEISISLLTGQDDDGSTDGSVDRDLVSDTPPLPLGLHSNFMVSLVGICTLTILWIPFPFLHWTGIEPFELPANGAIWLGIAGASGTGIVANATYMILLALWGPIIVSAGDLLSIVLVLITDSIFGPGSGVLTLWTILGSATIVIAFGFLSYDMFITDME